MPSVSATICQSKQGASLHHHTMSSTWPDEANKQSRGCQSTSMSPSQNQGRCRLMAIDTADSLSRLLQDDGGSAQLPFRP